MRFVRADHFEAWRAIARRMLNAEVRPDCVHWNSSGESGLFDDDEELLTQQTAAPVTRVPAEFLSLARNVACHRDSQRWELLYRTLWRLTHGERELLQVTTDRDVHALLQMQKGVMRDVHKMKAFVRFRHVVDAHGTEAYIAWHRPDHPIVRLAAPFFARRFPAMRWSILTPAESVHWDLAELHFGPGVPASQAPQGDALEELWRTYYASVFNPARVNTSQMKREMPVRHWPTLPEATLIPELLEQASARVAGMIDLTEGFADTAAAFIPTQYDLASLAAAASRCTACDLHCHATQTVFGRGPSDARIVLVGEQPGDREDLAGEPFVGPAGQLLNEALASAGLPRHQVYLTNVVKHFKFTPRGQRRLHKKPSSREITVCRPWLEAELKLLRPEFVVCLGSTAAQALFGREFRISAERGVVRASPFNAHTIATWHPAAILRMVDERRRAEMQQQLISDLAKVA